MSLIDVTISESVLTLRINRPEKKNALNHDMIAMMTQYFSGDLKDIKVIIISSVGPVFSSGADLAEMQSSPMKMSRALDSLCQALKTLSVPLIIVVEGHVYAGAHLLIGYADLVYAHDRVNFYLPELSKGFWPTFVSRVLSQKIPHKLLMRMIFSSKPVTAKEAVHGGLISDYYSNIDAMQLQIEDIKKSILNVSKSAVVDGMIALKQGLGGMDAAHHILNEQLQSQSVQEKLQKFNKKKESVE